MKRLGIADQSNILRNRLFVGGLTYDTTDEMLREVFSKFGNLLDCTVIRASANSNKCRGKKRTIIIYRNISSLGYGYVTFETEAMLTTAMNSGPHMIDDILVATQLAIPLHISRLNRNKSSAPIANDAGLLLCDYLTTYLQENRMKQLIRCKVVGDDRVCFIVFSSADSPTRRQTKCFVHSIRNGANSSIVR